MGSIETWGDIIDRNERWHNAYQQLQVDGNVSPETLLQHCPDLENTEHAQSWIEHEKQWEKQA